MVHTPNIARKSGSLNLNGIFDTCKRFGWPRSVEELVLFANKAAVAATTAAAVEVAVEDGTMDGTEATVMVGATEDTTNGIALVAGAALANDITFAATAAAAAAAAASTAILAPIGNCCWRIDAWTCVTLSASDTTGVGSNGYWSKRKSC